MATHVLGLWLQPTPALAIVDIEGENQQKQNLFLTLSFKDECGYTPFKIYFKNCFSDSACLILGGENCSLSMFCLT